MPHYQSFIALSKPPVRCPDERRGKILKSLEAVNPKPAMKDSRFFHVAIVLWLINFSRQALWLG